MNKLVESCPVCSEKLVITQMMCPQCRTTLEGRFAVPESPFSRLNAEQLQFLLTFIRSEGKFNRMEEEMGLSYPTLRSRFNEILRAMGMESSKEQAETRLTSDERRRILKDLNEGKIDLETAQKMLNGEMQPEKAQ